jgi:hypothetical protein
VILACDFTALDVIALLVLSGAGASIVTLVDRRSGARGPGKNAGGASLDNPPRRSCRETRQPPDPPNGETMRVPWREGDDIPHDRRIPDPPTPEKAQVILHEGYTPPATREEARAYAQRLGNYVAPRATFAPPPVPPSNEFMHEGWKGARWK